MKPSRSNQTCRALTLIEVVVVVAVLVVLVILFLPDHPTRAERIVCVSNLKQIGLACKLWAGDHGDRYPMDISVTNGGTMGLVDDRNTWINYFVMSNQLVSPKILHCPADTNVLPAMDFQTGFNNQNVSYFVGLDASESDPQTLLSGDDNFEVGGAPVKSGLLEISSNASIAWSAARHHFAGNIGLADGSVQRLSNAGLTNWLQTTGPGTNRLAIP